LSILLLARAIDGGFLRHEYGGSTKKKHNPLAADRERENDDAWKY
jgi:hypothetical protein